MVTGASMRDVSAVPTIAGAISSYVKVVRGREEADLSVEKIAISKQETPVPVSKDVRERG